MSRLGNSLRGIGVAGRLLLGEREIVNALPAYDALMREIAPEVWQIPLMPRQALNAYLVNDVLIDAGIPGMGRRLAERLASREVRAHAITHGHPDHVGGSRALCDALSIELWAPTGETEDVERGKATVAPGTWATRLLKRAPSLPAQSVARRLNEGDEIGDFIVIEAPGHSPGHVAYWREADGVLVAGDVFFNCHPVTTRPGLRAPARALTVDPERNSASMQRLADLKPQIALFGHGPPLYDASAKLRSFLGAR